VQDGILTPCRKVSKRILDGPGDNVAFFYDTTLKIILKKGQFEEIK